MNKEKEKVKRNPRVATLLNLPWVQARRRFFRFEISWVQTLFSLKTLSTGKVNSVFSVNLRNIFITEGPSSNGHSYCTLIIFRRTLTYVMCRRNNIFRASESREIIFLVNDL